MRLSRYNLRSVFVTVAIIAIVFALFGWYYRNIRMPIYHSVEIRRTLESLSDRRPPDMTLGQWRSAVAWTLNLHANTLMIQEADVQEMESFRKRLDVKLADDLSMDTIHWIWNEYARLCPSGEAYQRFKVGMLKEIATVHPNADVWGMRSHEGKNKSRRMPSSATANNESP